MKILQFLRPSSKKWMNKLLASESLKFSSLQWKLHFDEHVLTLHTCIRIVVEFCLRDRCLDFWIGHFFSCTMQKSPQILGLKTGIWNHQTSIESRASVVLCEGDELFWSTTQFSDADFFSYSSAQSLSEIENKVV